MKGKTDDKQDLCHNELASGIELFSSKFNEDNQLLTNTDRSWIINHTQSEIFYIKFLEFLFA